jgi:hypothetical protein
MTAQWGKERMRGIGERFLSKQEYVKRTPTKSEIRINIADKYAQSVHHGISKENNVHSKRRMALSKRSVQWFDRPPLIFSIWNPGL